MLRRPRPRRARGATRRPPPPPLPPPVDYNTLRATDGKHAPPGEIERDRASGGAQGFTLPLRSASSSVETANLRDRRGYDERHRAPG
ncbi:hypothetical protein HPB50_012420 [Hyalomma asiaticum]|uniref:Uncharacterized protein n=1 Tax=Hyalomma asiaticum TaxID=266040 RepID=A0ACB7SUW1_HYAAI|nr:hypothetical protein HPB50_012420 [Hyalomma asiaticum]